MLTNIAVGLGGERCFVWVLGLFFWFGLGFLGFLISVRLYVYTSSFPNFQELFKEYCLHSSLAKIFSCLSFAILCSVLYFNTGFMTSSNFSAFHYGFAFCPLFYQGIKAGDIVMEFLVFSAPCSNLHFASRTSLLAFSRS